MTGQRLRVLQVEDDSHDAELVVRALAAAGWDSDATRVGSGAALEQALATGTWDIVLSDFSMPGFDGIDALLATRAAFPAQPFVFVSGHMGEVRAVEVMRAGADGYVPKTSLERLGRVVHLALRDGEERRRRLAAERALRQSEERYRNMVEGAIDAVITIDQSGVIGSWNPAAAKMFGYSADEALGANVSTLMPQPYRAEHGSYLDRYRETGERRVIGIGRELVAQRRDGSTFPIELSISESGHGAERIFTGFARDVTLRQRLEAEVARQAMHDQLTGLPNRRIFLDRLEQSLARSARHQRAVAVLFVDIDRFKLINDTFGHAAGDEILRETGRRLADLMRSSDTVARFGGDEFVVLCEDVADESAACLVAGRLGAALAAPFTVGGSEIVVSASVGIAMGGDNTPEELVGNADSAMYRAKELGKAQYALFDGAMQVRGDLRLDVERDLHRALDEGQFELVYQPEVDISSGRTVGLEALLRWQHPERGLLAPAAFLGVAEDTGLMVPIGAWVLAEACRQMAAWSHVAGFPAVTTWVNVSARELLCPGFVDGLAETLTGIDLRSGCLGLEVTEGTLMDDAPATIATTRALRDLDVRLSIDDFGTGYSSLGYLKRFTVDSLKVDQSFVAGLGNDDDDVAIVTAIIALAKALRLEVVAEGVETVDQLAVLRSLGCDVAQGYYLGRPAPAAVVTQSLLAGAGAPSS